MDAMQVEAFLVKIMAFAILTDFVNVKTVIMEWLVSLTILSVY